MFVVTDQWKSGCGAPDCWVIRLLTRLQGLVASWRALSDFSPNDPSTFKSSWRFLAQVLLSPLGIINDHLDYKQILRTHTSRMGTPTMETAKTNGSLKVPTSAELGKAAQNGNHL